MKRYDASMHLWQSKTWYGGLVMAAILSACSGNPSLPNRQIDRPFTLPSDTRAFSLGVGASKTKDKSNSVNRVYPVGIWRIPISDTWTWELLSAVSHQFFQDEKDTYGILFGAREIGYGTSSGFFVEPVAELFYRRKFSKNFALENKLGGSFDYRENRSDRNGWSAFYIAAPLFQLDDSKSLSPFVNFSVEDRYSGSDLAWFDITPSKETVFAVPLGLDFLWRLSQGWETDFKYSYRGIGYTNGYSRHAAEASIIRYW